MLKRFVILAVFASLPLSIYSCSSEDAAAPVGPTQGLVDVTFPEVSLEGLRDPYTGNEIIQVEQTVIQTVKAALATHPKTISLQERAAIIVQAAKTSPDVHSATATPEGIVSIIFADGTPFVYMTPRPMGDVVAGEAPVVAESPVPNPSPTEPPEGMPTGLPSGMPSGWPTNLPSGFPSTLPSGWPSTVPSISSTQFPMVTNVNSAARGPDYLLSDTQKALFIDVEGLGSTNTAVLSGIIGKKGYTPKVSLGTSVDLRSMVKGVNFLWMASHSAAAAFEVNHRTYVHSLIQIGDPAKTSVETCPEDDSGKECRRIQQQNRSDELRYYLVRALLDPNSSETRWFMTRGFIQEYWTFAPESVAFMDICETGAEKSEFQSLRATLHAKNAHSIVGWDKTVSVIGAVPVIKRMIDRTVGANVYDIVSPHPNRPFSIQEVFQYMKEQNFDRESYGAARVTLHSKDSNHVILVPSIKHVEADERYNILNLQGEFGKHQKKITIAGTQVTIDQWGSREVKVKLNKTGAGSFGEIKIESDKRESNPLPLTQWIGNFRLRMTHKMYGTPGPWTDATCSKLKIRGDVHKYRDIPGRQLISGLYGMGKERFEEAAQEDFSCSWKVGGEGRHDESCRAVFDGGPGTMQWTSNLPEDQGLSPYKDNYMLFVGNIEVETRQFRFIPNATYHFRMKTYCKDRGGVEKLISDNPHADAFNANGMVKNWSELYPHTADSKWNFPSKSIPIPDLQGMPNERTLDLSFPAQAAPSDQTPG